ncbi:hypothetical protein [Pseudomonas phage vB_PaeM_RP13]|nr:hypothetical protein [Pseudomonas phage vB_PaeM_RP13]
MDLLLDENSHDIVFVNGQTPVTQGQVQIVAQRLKIKLWTLLGEWFLNLDVGVPYRQRILTKVAHKATVDIIFQRLLAEDEGVKEILEYRSEYNAPARRFTLEFKVRTYSNEEVAVRLPLEV